MNMLAGAKPGFEQEGAQRVRGQYFRHIYANLGDIFKEFATKGVGVRPPLACAWNDNICTITIVQYV